MHLLVRRHSRTGGAPSWLYALFAAGFVALAAWALVRGDWLVAVIAAVMFVAALSIARLMQRVLASMREAPIEEAQP